MVAIIDSNCQCMCIISIEEKSIGNPFYTWVLVGVDTCRKAEMLSALHGRLSALKAERLDGLGGEKHAEENITGE
jgi:hypothetical protein